jgi:thiamine kinase-like enzyme
VIRTLYVTNVEPAKMNVEHPPPFFLHCISFTMAPSEYVKSREAEYSRWYLIDGRPYLPKINANASLSRLDDSDEFLSRLLSGGSMSVIDVAICTVLPALRVAMTTNATDIGQGAILASSLSKEEVPPPVRGYTFTYYELFIKLVTSSKLTVTKITGGITNALYRVSGFLELKSNLLQLQQQQQGEEEEDNQSLVLLNANLIDFDSVLVRVFGAEGIINRDVETCTYSALCNAKIAYRHIGRFGNGRVEGWLDGYVPLVSTELASGTYSLDIAKEMAKMHTTFTFPSESSSSSNELFTHYSKVGLWDQLHSWMIQAKNHVEFKTPHDTERVKKLDLDNIDMEVQNFISSFTTSTSDDHDKVGNNEDDGGDVKNKNERIVFCHNDLLAGNIMRHEESGKIQLIDFEYGGMNYAAFDIANHWNEHAGGTSVEENGTPDYTRFPDIERQMSFCVEYVKTARELTPVDEATTTPTNSSEKGDDDDDDSLQLEAKELLEEVQKFLLVNHLYWGLWAINQAADEGCDGFDYINFATSRFNEFHAKK